MESGQGHAVHEEGLVCHGVHGIVVYLELGVHAVDVGVVGMGSVEGRRGMYLSAG